MMYQKDEPQTIQTLFNTIAPRYDLTNQVVSFSLHKYWNHALVKKILKDRSNTTYLDLCAGTGDIAFDYLATKKNPCTAYLIDFSHEMLEQAKIKEKKLSFEHHSIHYLETDVQAISLPDKSADCISMAYGIRNVQNTQACIKEVYRLLKPQGVFGILELTRPTHPLLRFGHQMYLKNFLPLVGKLLTRNKEAYYYLCQSIDSFIAPGDIAKIMQEEGFVNTRCYPLTGGIATLIIGYKEECENET